MANITTTTAQLGNLGQCKIAKLSGKPKCMSIWQSEPKANQRLVRGRA